MLPTRVHLYLMLRSENTKKGLNGDLPLVGDFMNILKILFFMQICTLSFFYQ